MNQLVRSPRRRGPPGVVARPAALLIARTVAGHGPAPIAVRIGGRAALVIVEPGPPEQRARALEGVHARFGLPDGVRVLTPPEYALLVVHGLETDSSEAHWGALPAVPRPSPSARLSLRRASGLLLHDLPTALGGRTDDARADAWRLALELRRVLEQVAPPATFPPLPADDARARELHRTTLGAAHVAFRSAQLDEPGPSLAAGALPEAPARSADAVRRLLLPLVADLGGPTRGALASLSLIPGPAGTRHAWTLLALVDDDTPLHRASALRDALQGHMGMLRPRRAALAALSPFAPVVLTRATFAAMLAGRLFRHPTRRIAIRLHRRVLWGDDPVPDDLPGLDASDDDRRASIAALIAATSAAWRSDVVAAQDLVWGAWPAAIHHARHGDPHASQASILAELARRADPAVARVGAARAAWGDPHAVGGGRAVGFLREWGPALIRLQEVAVESLR